jgi:hypothetical protein
MCAPLPPSSQMRILKTGINTHSSTSCLLAKRRSHRSKGERWLAAEERLPHVVGGEEAGGEGRRGGGGPQLGPRRKRRSCCCGDGQGTVPAAQRRRGGGGRAVASGEVHCQVSRQRREHVTEVHRPVSRCQGSVARATVGGGAKAPAEHYGQDLCRRPAVLAAPSSRRQLQPGHLIHQGGAPSENKGGGARIHTRRDLCCVAWQRSLAPLLGWGGGRWPLPAPLPAAAGGAQRLASSLLLRLLRLLRLLLGWGEGPVPCLRRLNRTLC